MVTIIIFILAFFLRGYNLALFALNSDEAFWTLGSINNFDKFLGIPVSCFHGYTPPFFGYLVFLTNKIFLSPEFIVRVPSVIVGSLTVLIIYKLAKELYDKSTGLITGFLLCLLPWHVIQSRIGVAIILTPLFGCLIFLALIKSIHRKSNLWFLLSWGFLGVGSFYTYQNSLLFVPIFLITLLLLRKDLSWVKFKMILLSILILLVILSPLIYLQMTNHIGPYLEKIYREYYNDSNVAVPFHLLLIKPFKNFKNNNPAAFESLFFASHGKMLYGAALESSLLISSLSLFIVLFSIIISLRRRKVSDKIILIWLTLGYLGGVLGVRYFQPRYIIIILVPLLILIGRFIAEMLNYGAKRGLLKYRFSLFVGIFLCVWLISIEGLQLVRYYQIAPTHFEECRRNSYGCKEAASYLLSIPDIESYQIHTDYRMTVLTYLKYLSHGNILYNKEDNKTKEKRIYYVIWAPESHSEDYWGGRFRRLYNFFKQKYPNEQAIKTIYYPDRMPALQIFRVG